MELTYEKRAKLVIVGLPQSLTTQNKDSETFKSELNKLILEGHKNIIVNMKKTTKIDVRGISALLVGKQRCSNADGTFVLANVNEPIKKIIQISQLEPILTIVNTVHEGVNFIMSPQ